jgi:hypothetical protein
MSRYSPTVQPRATEYDRMAGSLLEGIESARLRMLRGKREKERDTDRATAAEDRTRRIGHEDEDRTYMQGQRERTGVHQAIEDDELGIRTGEMPNPLAAQIAQLRGQMENPASMLLPFQSRLPGQLDSQLQTFDEAATETARYRPLAPGRYLDRDGTPEARGRRQAEAERTRLRTAAVGAGVPENAGDVVSLRPELIDNYLFPRQGPRSIEDEIRLIQERGRQGRLTAAERSRLSTSSSTRPRITLDQALRQVDQVYGEWDGRELVRHRLSPNERQRYAEMLIEGHDLPDVPQDPEPAPRQPGMFERIGNWMNSRNGGSQAPAAAPPPPSPPAAPTVPSSTGTPIGAESRTTTTSSSSRNFTVPVEELDAISSDPEFRALPEDDLIELLEEEGLELDDIEYILSRISG